MNKTPSHIQNKIAEIYEYIAKDDNGLPQVPVNLTPILEKFDIKAYNTSFKNRISLVHLIAPTKLFS